MSEENKDIVIPEELRIQQLQLPLQQLQQQREMEQRKLDILLQLFKKINKLQQEMRNPNYFIEKQDSNQIQQIITEFQDAMYLFCENYKDYENYEDYKDFPTKIYESFITFEKELKEYIIYIESLMPYFETELLQLQKLHPEMKNITLQNVLDCIDSNGNAIENTQKEIVMLIETAKEKCEADKGKISVGAKKPQSILFPLDKISQTLFKNAKVKSGRRKTNVEKSGSHDKLDTIVTFDFNELEESGNLTFRQLTLFEKRVYIACGALLEAGNELISATHIYKQMGGNGRPAKYQIDKIIEACEGMSYTKIKIDNREEAEKYNYPRFQEGLTYLLPAESVKNVEINGKAVDYCLHFLKDELPLFTFAKQRKQITSYTLEQWTLPFSMTEDNLEIDDYFRSKIARMRRENNKKKSYNGKMFYTTIYKACGIDTRKQRSRATEKFRKLLNHYKKTGIIAGYQEQQDGIIIIL